MGLTREEADKIIDAVNAQVGDNIHVCSLSDCIGRPFSLSQKNGSVILTIPADGASFPERYRSFDRHTLGLLASALMDARTRIP